MKYEIDYQYRPRGQARPRDDGNLVPFGSLELANVVLLPNVGDYVYIGATDHTGYRTESIMGRVASRYFRYQETETETFCHVNLVLDECEDEKSAELVKE